MLGQQGFGQPNLAAVPTKEQATTPTSIFGGWYSPLAKAIPAVATIVTSGLFLVPQPSSAKPSIGWYGELAKAPSPTLVASSWSFVPLNTSQLSVNFTNFGWFAGLSKAPLPLNPAPSYSYVPYNTTQITSYVPTLEWQQPFLASKPRPTNFASQPSFIAPIFSIPSGWAGQLYKAPDPLGSTLSWSYVPLNTTQLSVNFTNFGWYVQLTRAPAIVRPSTSWSYTPSFIQVVPQGWYTQLAHAPTILKPTPTYAYVPLNTAQVTPAVHPFGWYQQLSKAPRSVVPHPTQPSPFLSTTQRSNTTISLAWHQELSRASLRPAVQITWSFVPLNTAFFSPPFIETPAEPKYVRDFWDRDEWGNFIPGAGIRQV